MRGWPTEHKKGGDVCVVCLLLKPNKETVADETKFCGH